MAKVKSYDRFGPTSKGRAAEAAHAKNEETARGAAEKAVDDARLKVAAAEGAEERADEAADAAARRRNDARVAAAAAATKAAEAQTKVDDADTKAADRATALTQARDNLTTAETAESTAEAVLSRAQDFFDRAYDNAGQLHGVMVTKIDESTQADEAALVAGASATLGPAQTKALSDAARARAAAEQAVDDFNIARQVSVDAEETRDRADSDLALAQAAVPVARRSLADAKVEDDAAKRAATAARRALVVASTAATKATDAFDRAEVTLSDKATDHRRKKLATVAAKDELEKSETAFAKYGPKAAPKHPRLRKIVFISGAVAGGLIVIGAGIGLGHGAKNDQERDLTADADFGNTFTNTQGDALAPETTESAGFTTTQSIADTFGECEPAPAESLGYNTVDFAAMTPEQLQFAQMFVGGLKVMGDDAAKACNVAQVAAAELLGRGDLTNAQRAAVTASTENLTHFSQVWTGDTRVAHNRLASQLSDLGLQPTASGSLDYQTVNPITGENETLLGNMAKRGDVDAYLKAATQFGERLNKFTNDFAVATQTNSTDPVILGIAEAFQQQALPASAFDSLSQYTEAGASAAPSTAQSLRGSYSAFAAPKLPTTVAQNPTRTPVGVGR